MITLDTIQLPDELQWKDEFSWARASSAMRRTAGGKPVVEQSQTASTAGRPITLQSEHAWCSYADAQALRAWSDEVNKTMILTMHNGVAYQVMFRLWDDGAVDWTPIQPAADLESTDMGVLGLKLVIA